MKPGTILKAFLMLCRLYGLSFMAISKSISMKIH